MTKWWRRETHPDVVRRLEAVSLRLEETTQTFRDRLQEVAPDVLHPPDVEDPSRERGHP